MTKVRIFNDLTRDEMALKPPAEVQTMIGNPRLVELAYSQNRTYSPEGCESCSRQSVDGERAVTSVTKKKGE